MTLSNYHLWLCGLLSAALFLLVAACIRRRKPSKVAAPAQPSFVYHPPKPVLEKPLKPLDFPPEKDLKELIQSFNTQVLEQQYHPAEAKPMMPLCAGQNDCERVKALGASYCTDLETYFFPFNQDRTAIQEWLPRIYHPDQGPPLLTQLVPKPVWGANLRSLLHYWEWNRLRTLTLNKYGDRCGICSCKVPLECHEQWAYQVNKNWHSGVVHFKGLQALCPECHEVHHFGNAKNNDRLDAALARLMCINRFSYAKATAIMQQDYAECQQLAAIPDWTFNWEIMINEYGFAPTDCTDIYKQVVEDDYTY